MIKSYLKIALRNLIANKLYTFINLLGLSVAIAICIVAYVNYEFAADYNGFHENESQLYLIGSLKQSGDQEQRWTYIPFVMGDALRTEVPGIEHMARVSYSGGVMRHDDKVFNETFLLTDSDFFRMFSFPLLKGTPEVLEAPDAVIISEALAIKYFGDADPIGQQVTISPDGEQALEYIVRGVMKDIGKNSSIRADVAMSLTNLERLRQFDLASWNYFSRATFVQVRDPRQLGEIEKRFASHLETCNDANPDWLISGFYILPFSDLADVQETLRGDPFWSGMHPAAIVGPTVTAVLILLLACFNFVNTALAYAARRMKEIGVRKVIGGHRLQLILQFISENLLLCGFALIIGIGLSEIFVPAYDSLWPHWPLEMSFTQNYDFLAFLIVLLAFTGIAAGAYPAFYVSGFSPISILRGSLKLGSSSMLIRILLTFQFALAMINIISVVAMDENIRYLEEMDYGFQNETLVVVPVRSASEYDIFRQAIAQNPLVAEVAASRNMIAWSSSSRDVVLEGDNTTQVTLLQVGDNYMEASGIDLLQGRFFDRDQPTDIDDAIIVNQTLVKEFGWETPMGQTLTFRTDSGEKRYRVIGMVRDVLHNGVWRKVQPMIFSFSAPEDTRYMTVKAPEKNITELNRYLAAEWPSHFPQRPYEGFFFSEATAEAMQVNESIRTMTAYVGVIALLMAGLGLFALVSLNVSRRSKEIGIRKVLGANTGQLGRLISREFVYQMLVATVLAGVAGTLFMSTLMDSIWAYHVDLGLLPVIVSAIVVAISSAIVISTQVYRVATTNPIDALRTE